MSTPDYTPVPVPMQDETISTAESEVVEVDTNSLVSTGNHKPVRPTATDIVALSAQIDTHINNYMKQYETNLENVTAIMLVRLVNAWDKNITVKELNELWQTIISKYVDIDWGKISK